MKYRCTKCHKEISFDMPMAFCPFCGGKMEQVSDQPEVGGASAILIQEVRTILLSDRPTASKADVAVNADDVCEKLPSFRKVQDYVLKTSKIDKLFSNLEESIANIRTYLDAKGNNTEKLSLLGISNDVKDKDKYLSQAAAKLGWDAYFPALALPEIEAKVGTAIPDDILKPSLILLNDVEALEKKVKSFVITNSIFDNSCWSSYGVEERKAPKNILDELAKAIDATSDVCAKKYVYDFLGDSSEDVGEMMKTLWNGLALLIACSKKEIAISYSVGGQAVGDPVALLNDAIKTHYEGFDGGAKTLTDKLSTWDEKTLQNAVDAIHKLAKPSAKVKVAPKKAADSGDEKLNQLIGLEPVKNTIKMVGAYVAKNQGKPVDIHMTFEGNPGTGKTEVARIVAQILFEAGALPKNKLVETSRGDLVGQYIGETAQKTRDVIKSAMGGVLFIDEAYELAHEEDPRDFGSEAVAELLKAMEDYRGKFCVILAGYRNETEKMIATNPGFKSRIQFNVEFPDYSRDELRQIAEGMLAKTGYSCTKEALEAMLDLTDYQRKSVNFGNAREIRKFIDQATMAQSMRTISKTDAPKAIEIEDVESVAKTNKIPLHHNGDTAVETPEEQLAEMIGLDSVKKTIAKIQATVKKNPGQLNIHMCFYGNPGTGKTEVARVLSTLLYQAGALPAAKFVETDAAELVGKYAGSSGAKTQEMVDKAMGGVLFIDEAYSLALTPGGDESIATLLKEMEDKRGQFCVIMAGYRKEMLQMLSTNPGFSSRIQFTLDFPDYTRDELKEIAVSMLKKLKYSISDDALEDLAKITDIKRQSPDFANAREVRNIIQQVIMNASVRTVDDPDNRSIIADEVLQYAKDSGYDLSNGGSGEMSPELKKSLYDGIYALPSLYKEIANEKFSVNQKFLEQAVVSVSDEEGQGTGFIISPDGFVLTCAHCISKKEQKIRVAFFTEDGQRIFKYFPFVTILGDKINDVALLRIATDDYKFKFFSLASKKSADYTPTHDFYMAGYPFGGESFQEISVTTGKVASVNVINDGTRTAVFADMFGKPGNSGSPTIDAETSKVIGIFWGGIGPGPDIIPCFTPIQPIWELLKQALVILKTSDGDYFGE